MTKNEFAEHLRKQGYTVCFEEGVVIALNTSFEKIRREAKKAGYYASYGVRHTEAKQGQIAASKSIESYEQMSLF